MYSCWWNTHRLVKLLYSPTFTNISKFSGSNVVFCSKNFFRCSGSSNFSFLFSTYTFYRWYKTYPHLLSVFSEPNNKTLLSFSSLLCYSEWEFFLLQGLRDFPNKYDKVSGQFLFFEICQRQQNLKNEKCNTFYSACYSSKFTISPSFKKLFSELERVILPSFFSELWHYWKTGGLTLHSTAKCNIGVTN